jgi:hypothetical protein
MDTIFVSTPKSIWDSLPIWLSAIGTFTAVIVSLYLATKNERIKGRISLERCEKKGDMLIASNKPEAKWLRFVITNIGRRPFRVVVIGFQIGIIKKKINYIRLERYFQIDVIPPIFNDGDETTFAIDEENFKTQEISRIIKIVKERKFQSIAIRSLKLYVEISHGKRFYCKIPSILRQEYFR